MNPSVSVLMPTYNRAAYLLEAIDSVLAQGFGDLELIIVDDGSTDHTQELLASLTDPRVRTVRQDNAGISRALNAALSLAQGDVIARNDSDDIWLPHLLQTLLPRFEARPELGLVYGVARIFDQKRAATEERRGSALSDPLDPLTSLALRDTTSSITTLMRRDCLDALGGWDPELNPNEDWDMALRIATTHPIEFVDDVVALIRRHEGNSTFEDPERMRPRFQRRERVLDKLFSQSVLPAKTRAASDLAYRNLYLDEGHQYYDVGLRRAALDAYRRAIAVSHQRPRALGRLAWTWMSWFGPLRHPRVAESLRTARRYLNSRRRPG